MANKNRSNPQSLQTQAVIVFITIVILVIAVIGIPGFWLIQSELDRQTWELANKGSQMVKVLLKNRASELSNLAELTAQRPTLMELLEGDDQEGLSSYLDRLRTGAGLDLVLVCNRQGDAVAQSGLAVQADVCKSDNSTPFFQTAGETPDLLLASQPVPGGSGAFVLVGEALDQEFSAQIRAQSGLDHLFFSSDGIAAGSFTDNQAVWERLAEQLTTPLLAGGGSADMRITLDGTPQFAVGSRDDGIGLDTIVFLPGTANEETQQRLIRTASAGLLVVALFCVLTAILLTRWISRPLERLRDSANALRRGNLTSPVVTTTKVREIAEATYALEDARIALRHTLEELRREKAWGDYLLESVVEGIITIDRQGRITFFSQGAENITGWREEQVLGKAIDSVFLMADRESRFSERIPSPGGKPEIVTILVDNRPLILTIHGARLTPPEAGRADLAISIRDISNEEAMRGLLGDFISNITHEFRTPLTALAVSIELLMDQLPSLSREEIYELVVANRLGILSLQNLIDNLLEGASIEAGRFRVSPRPTELSDVIEQVVSMMRPLIDKNHQQLLVDLPSTLPLVQADPRRTSQVLVNLLSNATKWGPEGSEIYLNAVGSEAEVKVSIGDQGPGINPEHKSNLFVRFGYRQRDNGSVDHGTGLGLSVVKAIVESQKGRVGAEDRQGGGAVFWFTIPTVELFPDEEEDL